VTLGLEPRGKFNLEFEAQVVVPDEQVVALSTIEL
jgi:hypothetical protein